MSALYPPVRPFFGADPRTYCTQSCRYTGISAKRVASGSVCCSFSGIRLPVDFRFDLLTYTFVSCIPISARYHLRFILSLVADLGMGGHSFLRWWLSSDKPRLGVSLPGLVLWQGYQALRALTIPSIIQCHNHQHYSFVHPSLEPAEQDNQKNWVTRDRAHSHPLLTSRVVELHPSHSEEDGCSPAPPPSPFLSHRLLQTVRSRYHSVT